MLAGAKLHTDDTPVPVLAPGMGKTKTGGLWGYARDDRPWSGPVPPAAVFFYSADRKAEWPRDHLNGFSGFPQADAYAGYDRLYQHGRIIAVGCWGMSGVSSSTSTPPTARRWRRRWIASAIST